MHLLLTLTARRRPWRHRDQPALRHCECFSAHTRDPTHDNVPGVPPRPLRAATGDLRHITSIVMRADNQGEGGILSLTGCSPEMGIRQNHSVLVALGIVGASPLCGEGVITPAGTSWARSKDSRSRRWSLVRGSY